mmetsp:Transcript_43727/g.93610  ORF Transcript_43727/g.93610 Transcript_43727/m.93610 type:complete len:100 (+) Transcript_43727:471-770(+)
MARTLGRMWIGMPSWKHTRAKTKAMTKAKAKPNQSTRAKAKAKTTTEAKTKAKAKESTRPRAVSGFIGTKVPLPTKTNVNAEVSRLSYEIDVNLYTIDL